MEHHQIPSRRKKAFIDSATGTSVILGLYSLNNTREAVLALNRYGSMSADDAYFLTSTTFDAFKNNTLSAGNDANTIWLNPYVTIGRANFAIEGLQKSTLSSSVKNQLLGEAKFWRAYFYFYLVNLFGDVPLVTSTNALETGLLPRTSTAQVNQQIVADLLDAKKPAYQQLSVCGKSQDQQTCCFRHAGPGIFLPAELGGRRSRSHDGDQ